MNDLLIKTIDPYVAYRARVESERKSRNLKPSEITNEEVKWKLEEISRRFNKISPERKEKHRCYYRHYEDAKSLSGTIQKAGKITEKQWNKLVDLSFTLYEIEHPRGLHYCG